MNRALKITNRWCQQKGLSLNPSRAVIVTFTHKNKLDKLLKLMEKEIQLNKAVKYLGVTLDQWLNWNEHIQYISNKAAKA